MQRQWRLWLPVALTIVTLIGALTSSAPWSQAGQAIRLILPFPPGGPADIMARLVAQQIGSDGGPTMVVESHPGAASEIGTEFVSWAGYPQRRHFRHCFAFVRRAPIFPQAQLRSAERF
jgi:tripartite-type tricarboxylate transporter receptor subunit TctC